MRLDDVLEQSQLPSPEIDVDAAWTGVARAHGRRRRQRRVGAVGGVALLVVAAAVATVLALDGGESGTRVATESSGPPISSGPGGPDGPAQGWRELPEAPIDPRVGAATVSTDEELVVWGGGNDGVRDDGAAYSYATGTWRTLSPSPLTPRRDVTAVWTGEEVLVLGGTDEDGRPIYDRPAAAWNPRTDRWRELTTPGFTVHRATTAVTWTGEELVVVEPDAPPNVFLPSDTIAIDPTTGDWRALDPSPGSTGSARGRVAVPTADEVLVVTIADGTDATIDRLDPDSGSWGATVATGVPGLEVGADGVVWTGAELVVVNHLGEGAAFDPEDDSVRSITPNGSGLGWPAVALDEHVVTVGDRWLDVDAGTWHDAEPVPGPFREFPGAVAHAGALYVWGGDACGPAASCVGLVDPGPGLTWTPPPR